MKVFNALPGKKAPEWLSEIEGVEVRAVARIRIQGMWFVEQAYRNGLVPQFWSVYGRVGGEALVLGDFDDPRTAEKAAHAIFGMAGNAAYIDTDKVLSGDYRSVIAERQSC